MAEKLQLPPAAPNNITIVNGRDTGEPNTSAFQRARQATVA